MRKSDIVTQIADKTGIPRTDVIVVLETFMKETKKNVIAGEGVTLRGFGTFSTKRRKEKQARNIRAKTQVFVPAHNIVHFIPAKEFKAAVKQASVKNG